MIFPHLEWFVLVPLLALVGWQFKYLQLQRPWRIICCLLLVVALVDPHIQRTVKGIDLWVLVDRSASTREWTESNMGEWEAILEKSRGEHDRLRFVDFAKEAQARSSSESSFVLDDRSQSNLGLGLRQLLLLHDEERSGKILLLSDGYYTDSIEEMTGALIDVAMPFDFRLSSNRVNTDFQVSALGLPQSVQVDQAFAIDVQVDGLRDERVNYAIYRNDTLLRIGETQLKDGKSNLRFFDRIGRSSSVAYTAQINFKGDQVPGNNRMTRWLRVEGPERILLVSNFLRDPVGQVLESGGFEVEHIRDFSTLSVRSLSGASSVIINDVSANQLPSEFLEGLDFFVREQGGGLLMLGGPSSFGSGGYYGSPVERLIPVSMELKQDHKKLAVAMCVVVDRSGSMSAPVEGQNGMTKMDLANAGAVNVLELLGPQDAFSYLAVDTEAHVVVPLTEVQKNRGRSLDLVRRVASMGGGIHVYNGLEAGWAELKKSTAGQRHIILFSDARDSVMPGEYKTLIAEMIENKTTISVIALGEETDADADFLKDIAERGDGRIFFNTDAADLPALFTQETVAIARSAFIEEETATLETAGWLELGSGLIDWLPSVQGYNLSYLRNGATMALATEDEYKAPLVAYWQQGVGRVGAITFAMGGEHAWKAIAWEKYGGFTQTLNRWLIGNRQPEGISLESNVKGNVLNLNLYYSDERAEQINNQMPIVKVMEGVTVKELVWERVAPGHMELTSQLANNVPVRVAVQVGKTSYPLGPFFVGNDEEWRNDSNRIQNIKSLSKRTGGKELLNLNDSWEHPPKQQLASIRLWILYALIGAFLIEVALTRLSDLFTLWKK